MGGSYRLGDVDVEHSCGAEGGRAAVPRLHHQGPRAVLLLGDVVDDLQGLDVGPQLDVARRAVDDEDIVVGLRLHDGILDDVVGRLRVLVHRLRGKRSRCEIHLVMHGFE